MLLITLHTEYTHTVCITQCVLHMAEAHDKTRKNTKTRVYLDVYTELQYILITNLFVSDLRSEVEFLCDKLYLRVNRL